jgi:hypothetical protein
VDKKRNPNDPTGPLNHTLRVFLIDREGRIRNIYSSGTLDSRLVLADVRTLMLEVEVEPGPFQHDDHGANLPRPKITVTDPAQIQIERRQ